MPCTCEHLNRFAPHTAHAPGRQQEIWRSSKTSSSDSAGSYHIPLSRAAQLSHGDGEGRRHCASSAAGCAYAPQACNPVPYHSQDAAADATGIAGRHGGATDEQSNLVNRAAAMLAVPRAGGTALAHAPRDTNISGWVTRSSKPPSSSRQRRYSPTKPGDGSAAPGRRTCSGAPPASIDRNRAAVWASAAIHS